MAEGPQSCGGPQNSDSLRSNTNRQYPARFGISPPGSPREGSPNSSITPLKDDTPKTGLTKTGPGLEDMPPETLQWLASLYKPKDFQGSGAMVSGGVQGEVRSNEDEVPNLMKEQRADCGTSSASIADRRFAPEEPQTSGSTVHKEGEERLEGSWNRAYDMGFQGVGHTIGVPTDAQLAQLMTGGLVESPQSSSGVAAISAGSNEVGANSEEMHAYGVEGSRWRVSEQELNWVEDMIHVLSQPQPFAQPFSQQLPPVQQDSRPFGTQYTSKELPMSQKQGSALFESMAGAPTVGSQPAKPRPSILSVLKDAVKNSQKGGTEATGNPKDPGTGFARTSTTGSGHSGKNSNSSGSDMWARGLPLLSPSSPSNALYTPSKPLPKYSHSLSSMPLVTACCYKGAPPRVSRYKNSPGNSKSPDQLALLPVTDAAMGLTLGGGEGRRFREVLVSGLAQMQREFFSDPSSVLRAVLAYQGGGGLVPLVASQRVPFGGSERIDYPGTRATGFGTSLSSTPHALHQGLPQLQGRGSGISHISILSVYPRFSLRPSSPAPPLVFPLRRKREDMMALVGNPQPTVASTTLAAKGKEMVLKRTLFMAAQAVEKGDMDVVEARMSYFSNSPFVPFACSYALASLLPALLGKRTVHILLWGDVVLPILPALIRLLVDPEQLKTVGKGAGMGLKALRVTALDWLPLRFPGQKPVMALHDWERVGVALEHEAQMLGVEFNFEAKFLISPNLDSLNRLERGGDAVAFCGVYEMDYASKEPGVEDGPRYHQMKLLKRLRPDIVVLVEEELDTDYDTFLEQFQPFVDALWAMKHAFDVCSGEDRNRIKLMSMWEKLEYNNLAMHALACEGNSCRAYPLNRHGWERRMEHWGFRALPVLARSVDGMNTMLKSYPEGFALREFPSGVVLSLHGEDLAAASSWQSA